MGLNVLVVEDDKSVRAMVSRMLRLAALGVEEVYEAANGREGLEKLARHRIDATVIDIHMPVMDGLAMLSRLRSDPQTAALPVVMISSGVSPSRVREIERRDARFLQKPFTAERLQQALLEVLPSEPRPE